MLGVLAWIMKFIGEIIANVFKDQLKTPAQTAVKNVPAALSANDVPSDAHGLLDQHEWLLDRDED